MGLLDYIFKSKAKREKEAEEAKEAEYRQDMNNRHKADRLFKIKKYDEALQIYLPIIKKNYRDLDLSVYTNTCKILWDKKRYTEILDVTDKFNRHRRWIDRDVDETMSWYESYATIEIKKQEAAKNKPQAPAQPQPQPQPKVQAQPKPTPSKPVQQSAQPTLNEAFNALSLERVHRRKSNAYSLGHKYNMAKKQLPKYTFLTSDLDIPSEAKQALIAIEAEAQKLLDRANEHYRKKEIIKAADCYEELVAHRYWKPEPYTALINIYEAAKRYNDAQEIKESGAMILSDLRRRMKNQLLDAAKAVDAEDIALEIIEKGERVEYDMGLYTLYDPFPCVEQWLQELC